MSINEVSSVSVAFSAHKPDIEVVALYQHVGLGRCRALHFELAKGLETRTLVRSCRNNRKYMSHSNYESL